MKWAGPMTHLKSGPSRQREKVKSHRFCNVIVFSPYVTFKLQKVGLGDII